MTVNLTRIYTKLGDGGETHLGDMSRVPKTHVRIEESSFRYSTYKKWLDENAASIAAFKTTQQAAFEAERERWRAA